MKTRITYPKVAGIYKLTCNVNGKIYIGKSVNIRRRLNDHKNCAKNGEGGFHLRNAIIKHGWNNFVVDIIERFDIFDKLQDNAMLLKLESYYIKKYNSIDRSIGYNLCSYSNDRTGIPRTQETKEKLRLANLGRIHSDETKNLLSELASGENHPMWGKHYDKDKLNSRSGENSCWYGKTGSSHPAYGRSHTHDAKIKIKNKRATQDVSYLKHQIIQFDLNTGEYIKTWDCSVTAGNALGIAPRSIRAVCNKEKCSKNAICKSAGGFGWKFPSL